MEMTTNAISWCEIPALDFERAKTFYSRIFDYEMPVIPMDTNVMGILPHEQGSGVGGAIIHGEGNQPSREGTLVYLNGGADLNTVLNRVESAGGKVLVPKTDIGSGMGFFAHFLDTEGNRLGIHSMG
jgi:uncharacterized protein